MLAYAHCCMLKRQPIRPYSIASTGHSTQYSVMTYLYGKRIQRRVGICICMTDSLAEHPKLIQPKFGFTLCQGESLIYLNKVVKYSCFILTLKQMTFLLFLIIDHFCSFLHFSVLCLRIEINFISN